MKESIQMDVVGLYKQFEAEALTVADLNALTHLRDKWLGRERGIVPSEMKKLGTLPKELRPEHGRLLNQLKADVEKALDDLLKRLKDKGAQASLEREKIDVTLPGYPYPLGHMHPLRLVREEIESILVRMGFTIIDTPEVEKEYYNFEALNIPQDHPARDAQDTFYITKEWLLRTHCTTMQLHAMERMQPPLRVASSGKVYRRDKPDATHSPMFYQLDGLVVDEGITMRDLKGTLEAFAKALFSTDTKVNFFPSYFPFVEPGADLAVSCIFCRGGGCSKCKQSGWIELLGAGMVHPSVFKNAGYDPEKYTGFAWGMGIDRVAIVKYGIEDIRLLFENDLRFLEQFS